MTTENTTPVAFSDLGLPDAMLKVLSDIGYETPSPIQEQTIPLLLEGRDVLGQAQTGTGKTAAFALPILARLDMQSRATQVLVLAPTRELAIQVAEAFQTYAAFIKGFHVLPIYGGASYSTQLRQLKQGAQVVVGTPGRVMDHMRRATLDLSQLKCLVLDEADEMLRMGFIDDVEWILEQTPEERQIALFSATMPREIRRIAQKYLDNPAEISIANKTTTASTIRQRYWGVSGTNKLDALTRMLEAEDFEGMLIFVRTKNSTVELSDKLRARGYNCAPLNGDIVQAQRENTVAQLKSGALDIVVATDVAARGLDVERISHVINYDIPTDTEAYVHRIGRTGRAGRTGDAILFVAPREKRLLFAIEKATRQQIERMELPSPQLINNKRIERFKQQITDMLEKGKLDVFREVIAQYQHEHGTDVDMIAAALAAMAHGDSTFLLDEKSARQETRPEDFSRDTDYRERPDRDKGTSRKDKQVREVSVGMKRYRIEAGHNQHVKPGNIVGAIANEADINSKLIGNISIFDEYTTVDLPDDLSATVIQILKKARVNGKPMNMMPFTGSDAPASTGAKSDVKKDSPFKKERSFHKEPSFNKDSAFKKDNAFKKDSATGKSSAFGKEKPFAAASSDAPKRKAFAKKLPDSAEKPYKSAAPTEKPAFKKTAKPKTENPRLWVTDDKGLAKERPKSKAADNPDAPKSDAGKKLGLKPRKRES